MPRIPSTRWPTQMAGSGFVLTATTPSSIPTQNQGPNRFHARVYKTPVPIDDGLGRVARQKPRQEPGNLAPPGQEGLRARLRRLQRGPGCCSLLRLDRRAEETRKRQNLATEVRSTLPEKPVVEDQPRESRSPDRTRPNEACRPGGNRQRKKERPLGRCL